MKLSGISKIVSNNDVASISELWKTFYSLDIASLIPNKISDDVIAVYTRYQGDYTQPYTIIIGYQVSSRTENKDIDFIEIDNARHETYVVKGKMPDVVIHKWSEIWNSNRKRSYIADYDVYKPDGTVEIHVEYQ